MQQLVERRVKPNTPTDTSLVCSSVVLSLNKEETLSEQNLKTFANNLEVNNSKTLEVLKTLVYVRSIDGKPLMPCTSTKARKLLESGRAKIVSHKPFVIQLTFECENKVQEITLGVDPGYENVGLSAVSSKKELFSAEVKLRNNISRLLMERAMYRRLRRKRLWYRKPRFLNRKNMKRRLPPSIQYRLDAHIKIVDRVCSLFPISVVKVEIANFDIQKIKNPEIKGIEYQQGDLYQQENIRSYLIEREHGKCQLCGKEATKGNPFIAHHSMRRSNGGTAKVEDLKLLHKKRCHKKAHEQNLDHLLYNSKQYKAETFMSIMRKRLIKKLRQKYDKVVETYGYITKVNRQALGLGKNHSNDAFVIAGGAKKIRSFLFLINKKKHNNRCLQLNRKGNKPFIRRRHYEFQPKDLVIANGASYTVIGTFDRGLRIRVKKNNTTSSLLVKTIEEHYYINGWQWLQYREKVV